MESNVLEIIIAAIVGNTLVVAILAFLFKSIINHRLEKDMALYQARIEANAKETLSEYESKLEKERIRLQISYGGIFEKQAESIIQIYDAVLEFEKNTFLAIHSTNEEDFKTFIVSSSKLYNLLNQKRILLPDTVVKMVEKIQNDIFWGVDDNRRIEYRLGRNNISDKLFEVLFKKQDEALKVVNSLPELKNELIVELRNLIGIAHSYEK